MAHADAQEVEGRLREPFGGGAAELPGIRLMASGLGSPALDNGDVTDAGRVDLGQIREWYAERAVPGAVRVPGGVRWTAGHRLLEKRLMALPAGRAGPAAALGGVGVLEHARRRGIAAAVSSWLLQHAVGAGAQWAHLSPDTEQAARVYRRLGFSACGSFTVHIDL